MEPNKTEEAYMEYARKIVMGVPQIRRYKLLTIWSVPVIAVVFGLLFPRKMEGLLLPVIAGSVLWMYFMAFIWTKVYDKLARICREKLSEDGIPDESEEKD